MAWEVARQTRVCIRNGKVSGFPHALDRSWIPDILKYIINPDGNDYYIKKDKHYITIDGEVYIKYVQDENDSLYNPNI